jgi:peptide/nickel transport system permease protein
MVSSALLYIIRRAINAFVTILLLLALVFTLIHSILNTPLKLAKIYLPTPRASPAELQQVIHQFHLNAPLWVQFWNFVSGAFQGNFGYDTLQAEPETKVLQIYLPITIELVITGTIIGVLIGVYTGAIAAANRNRTADYGVKAVYLTTWSAPVFLVCYVLALIFAYWLNLLPPHDVYSVGVPVPPAVTGMPVIDGLIAGNFAYTYSAIQHLILPAFSIALAGFGLITRLTRASMIDALDRDYVKLAYMKGLSKGKVVWGTAFRNAIIPIITLVALLFGLSVGGAVITEVVFLYHGMGYFTYNAITNFDYNAILAFTLITGIAVVLANLTADFLYAWADPRVRLT